MDANNSYWNKGALEQNRRLFSEHESEFWYEVNSINDAQKLLGKLYDSDAYRLGTYPGKNGYKSCLDYGCGVGRVLRYMSGVFGEAYGYDPNNPEFNKLPNRNFDFIYSVGVLKHNVILDQVLIIEWCFEHLNPGGTMILEVPVTGDWIPGEPRGEVFPIKMIDVLFRDKKNCLIRICPNNIESHFLIVRKF